MTGTTGSRLGRESSRGSLGMQTLRARILAALLAGLTLLAITAGAQTTTTITLDQAVDLALAHNHSLLAIRTQVDQAQAEEITANLRPNPTLGFDTQFIPIFSPSQFS